MKVMDKTQLDKLFGAGYEVIAPVNTLGVVEYIKVTVPAQIEFDFYNSKKPAKSAFFPATEKMFDIKMQDRKAVSMDESLPEMKDTILFGIRPCDAGSLTYMDQLFNWEGFEDPYWNARREAVTVFTLGCSKVCPNSFCTSVGGGPKSKTNADVFVYEVGDKLVFEAITDKGSAALDKMGLEEATGAELEAAQNWEPAEPEVVDLDETPTKLDDRWPDEHWVDVSLRCLNCGICTFLCPTCHCFDIIDYKHRDKCARCRVWDTCQFDDYTVHASGHQPRETKQSRVRNRILHKFNYIPHNFDMFGCVGCGRCTSLCPVNIDLIETIQEVEK